MGALVSMSVVCSLLAILPKYNASNDPRKQSTLSAASIEALKSRLALEYELYHFIQQRLNALYRVYVKNSDAVGL